MTIMDMLFLTEQTKIIKKTAHCLIVENTFLSNKKEKSFHLCASYPKFYFVNNLCAAC
jgi:hypothetical protein